MSGHVFQSIGDSLTHTEERSHEIFHVATHGTCEFLLQKPLVQTINMKLLIAALYFHEVIATQANAAGHWLS
jgi:hypothetical protein